jgi:glycosyltransferase involved in cell wall biosynthesis
MVVLSNPLTPPNCSADLGSDRARRILLNVGRLDAQKDQLTLIDAFARVASVYLDWDLHIFGVGPLENVLRDRIRAVGLEGRIYMRGVVTDIGKAYRSADIFVLSSRYESFGLVTSEAMSYGLPVLGFADCPGTNELIDNGHTGLLAPAQSDRSGALASVLQKLMSDPVLRRHLGDAGQQAIGLRRQSVQVVTDAWEKLFADVVGQEPQRGQVIRSG